ncbi:mRNA-decapping enzyme subunit 1, putative [Plasmodium knowlesi strain H]|uniref:mRNA-decapping enzyme subunit 1, putative n=3 Tax=Plasmodium knowlesi TaxID=5850 RepID=A0A5K1UEC2_PLAKH|nr:mRNA-decapping enzyme subunit 1, putative [Plasmodium knowlesi strain H]OTN68250.1 putative Asparagine-rich antigen [Plasmodium knowlesi]CAA9987219.1 mRNA-decapping enzyme subunit 1, putative [Plasmodium knowlesi strain H]SBO23985.1 mRNA-decapping enzyme subunit 1, putative [Plasmodium knowlesi strain H]SBO25961.1 mRNA-decapping enzyme subunit 1, putative [Plasmodium knowlesi strain H]VVS76693.1 mRNA-decapping enzyme subunit 1, putative [Plasmodium knowlesi strain H]|eukprot:XP_002261840.1 asparagine-rich antigen, putative [Plasmodium knowlesi strain H]
MKKKNIAATTSYGKVKSRVNRYDMNGSYNFTESKNGGKVPGGSTPGDGKKSRAEAPPAGKAANNATNSTAVSSLQNSTQNTGGGNPHHVQATKYVKNAYPYDYNAYGPKKVGEYKEKMRGPMESVGHGGDSGAQGEGRSSQAVTNNAGGNKGNGDNAIGMNPSGGNLNHANGGRSQNTGRKGNKEERLNEEVSLLREKICFKMLKSIDIYITEIIMKSSFVTVYKMKEDELKWVRADIEGFLYIVRRSIKPTYRLIITNKKNENHLVQDIHGRINLSTDQNYIFYRVHNEESNLKSTYSLWFYSTEEKEKIYSMLKELVDKGESAPSVSGTANLGNPDISGLANGSNVGYVHSKNINFILSKGESGVNEGAAIAGISTGGGGGIVGAKPNDSSSKNMLMNGHEEELIKGGANHVGMVGGGDNSVQRKANGKNLIPLMAPDSGRDNDCEKNFELMGNNKLENLYGKMNIPLGDGGHVPPGAANAIYGNYLKHLYKSSGGGSGGMNGMEAIGQKSKMKDAPGEEGLGGCDSNMKGMAQQNHIDFNDKVGRKLLYLIKGLPMDGEKGGEKGSDNLKKLPGQDFYEGRKSEDMPRGSGGGTNNSVVDIRGVGVGANNTGGSGVGGGAGYPNDKGSAISGGEAIMNLLGLSKNGEVKEDEVEDKKKKKKKKGGNGEVAMGGGANASANANISAVPSGDSAGMNHINNALGVKEFEANMQKRGLQLREMQMRELQFREMQLREMQLRGMQMNGMVMNGVPMNGMAMSHPQGNDLQMLPLPAEEINGKAMKKYGKGRSDCSEEPVGNKHPLEKNYLERPSFQNNSIESLHSKEVEVSNGSMDDEKNMTNALLDIIKQKADRENQIMGVDGVKYHGGHDSISEFNTDSYDMMLKMQGGGGSGERREKSGHRVSNRMGSHVSGHVGSNFNTQLSSHMESHLGSHLGSHIDNRSHNGPFDEGEMPRMNNHPGYSPHDKQLLKYEDERTDSYSGMEDYKNGSILLNRNTIHNVIKETLQSDEFVNLLWKKLVMSKNIM